MTNNNKKRNITTSQQQPKQQQNQIEEKPPLKSILKKPKQVEEETQQKPSKKQKQINSTTRKSQIITVGSYEHAILGYEPILLSEHPEVQNPDGLEVHLNLEFAYTSHTGSIKALGSTNNTLVSSGSDDTLKIYNLSKKAEYGTLMKHEGYITSIKFYKQSHLIVGSKDKTLSIWRCSDWECLKVMKGPKGEINSLSIHPSGKAALSVSKDKRMFLWDLVKGTSAHFTKFQSEAFIVQWSPSGDHYALVFADRVVIYTADGKELHSFDFPQQVLALKFYDNETLLVGGEDKLITLIDYKNGKIKKTLEGHETRIKGLDTLSFKSVKKPYIVSISSDGNIVIWNINSDLPVGLAESDMRLNSITICPVDLPNEDPEEKDDSNIKAPMAKPIQSSAKPTTGPRKVVKRK
eukprot:gene1416-1787_t